MAIYAGIGSRNTPVNVLRLMEEFGAEAAKCGHTLRSGGAHGADNAFTKGALSVDPALVRLYVPWQGYNNNTTDKHSYVHPGEVSSEALDLAATFHPAWGRCQQAARKLHARNACIMLSASLEDPVDLVVCWTDEAQGRGITGQALRVAKEHDVEILDLGRFRGGSGDEIRVELNDALNTLNHTTV